MTQTDNTQIPYTETFMTERPKDTIDLLQARLRSALKLNDEMADYFKERAAVEDLYAKNLAKLNKKLFITDKSALGGILPAWEKIQNELVDTSTIHATFALKMVNDIEKPLRSIIVTDQAYVELRSMDPTFQKLAKDYDDRQGKMIKQKKNIDKSGKRPSDVESKYADIKNQFDTTKSEWEQSSTKYIQLFQNIDEHRLSGIKNHLIEFETIQTDQMLKRVQLAGDNLASVSDLSVENEIMAFCTQYTTNDNINSTLPCKSNDNTMLPPSLSSSSMQSTPFNSTNTSNMAEPTSPSHSALTTPSLLIDISDDLIQPQSTKSTESYISSHTVATHAPSLPPVVEDIDDGQRSVKAPSIKSNKSRKFLSAFSIRRKPKSFKSNQFGHQLADIPDSATQDYNGKANSFMDNASIYSIQEDTTLEANKQPIDQSTPSSSNTLHAPTLRKTSSFADSFFNQPSSPHKQSSTPSILVDDEGFSIPPPDRSPWTMTTSPTTTLTTSSFGDDQQDSNDIASMDSASLYGTPRIKLDIKADSVVEEDAKSSQVAVTRVVSMLKESNPSTIKRPRGRRELRSQLLQGNVLSVPQTTTSSGTLLQKPATMDEQPSTNLSDPDLLSPFAHDDDNIKDKVDDDTETFVTMPTPSLANHSDVVAVEENKPTISVRITEVIHAQLLHGQAQRIMVTGEVALLYQGPKDDQLAIPFLVKHNGTEATLLADGIERIKETDQGVLYQLTPSRMDDQDYMTCIKYRQAQQQEKDTLNLVVPLLVKPMWKCDGDQARLMIKYSKTNGTGVGQVMMLTHVDGNCHNAQSLPSGQWIMDQQKMVWSLDDDDVQEEQVIRAKFATTSTATPQPIAIRFEMRDQLVSALEVVTPDSTLHSGPWATINSVTKHTRSGKYIAEV
ncbi:hypothetical protein BC941DRAFT_435098 [Chlamydoabsidia padenii]|nr:hypothetical protein BC941DRAFT_435098 [Chlamydoabsidia padenii]